MIRIRPASITNTLPVTSFTVTPNTGVDMLTVTANSEATVDADTDLMHHTWDWGDGSTFYAYSDLKTTHTYSAPGLSLKIKYF